MENLLNFENPKIIPKIVSNAIEEICKIDKRLPQSYNYIYAFNEKIFSFGQAIAVKIKFLFNKRRKRYYIKERIN